MIVGGALVPFYAEMRQTSDIDLVIQLSLTGKTKNMLIEQLVANQFTPFTTWNDTFLEWPRQSFVTFLDARSMIKIDMNLLKNVEQSTNKYMQIGILAMKRRVQIDYLGILCWAQSKEDFILAKLVYEGYQDYRDALACWIRYEEEMDVDYLRNTCKMLSINDLLDAIMEKKPVEDVFPD
ncbi:MAG TPA: hypothetical protein VKM55_00245 [Candidatus Lokiarchaeia archaeon]|nr:hypothetical protein [Candidatus Lokiarchaeia archaeon]